MPSHEKLNNCWMGLLNSVQDNIDRTGALKLTH